MNKKPSRPGAAKRGKKASVGSGGQGRQALEGRGPTPKAEDRPYHPAGKRKAAQERLEATRGGRRAGAAHARRDADPATSGPRPARQVDPSRGFDPNRAPKSGKGTGGGRARANDGTDLVNGRNPVVEALRSKIPADTLYLAQRLEVDDRIRESIKLATSQGLAVVEVMRQELDRMVGMGEVHQGIALRTKSFQYSHPDDILRFAKKRGEQPLIVAVDGITDPRNLGAIIRSVAAFGGHGVIIPGRRSVGVTPSAWKTSAGAAARIPIASVSNLTQSLVALKKQGIFILGLDGGGDMLLPDMKFATDPIVLVIGSEGKGLSRLVTETCDSIVSVPIAAAVESLNAGIAASVSLYEVSRLRSKNSARS